VRTATFLLAVTVAAILAVAATANSRPAQRSTELVVALDLAGSRLQAGAVRGSQVVLAKGFEVELAKAIARDLGVKTVTFLNVPRERIVAPGKKSWSFALGQLSGPARGVDFSTPYLQKSHAVVVRRGLRTPTKLGALRGLQLCAEKRTSSATVVVGRVRPALPALLASDTAAMLRRVQTGACDAAVLETTELRAALAGRADRLGPVVGRIETDVAYSIALPNGSPLTQKVNRALKRLRADGTLARLRSDWLGGDPLRLRALR
jgi:polar amino acid transport system substrate-binding protein